MKTADEIASMFFADTGEKKSTNWSRLRDAVAARDEEWKTGRPHGEFCPAALHGLKCVCAPGDVTPAAPAPIPMQGPAPAAQRRLRCPSSLTR